MLRLESEEGEALEAPGCRGREQGKAAELSPGGRRWLDQLETVK